MFGRRSTPADTPHPRPAPAEAPASQPQPSVAAAPPPPKPEPKPERAPPVTAKQKERKPTLERSRSEEYYDVKTTVFNALIDTIDLTQLSKLDPEAAREEIRDIVSEIVAIKNVVMSIAE